MFRTKLNLAATFPELQTARLTLRQIQPADQMQVYRALSDTAVVKHYGVEYHSFLGTSEQMQWYQELYQRKSGLWWALTLKNNTEMIGAGGYYNWQADHQKAELGYWLLPAYWRQGLMREALPAIVGYGQQQMGLHRIEAYVETANQASANLLQQLGFQHEGTLRDTEMKHGQFISLAIFALLTKERA